jgi:hypothetical protein
MAQGTGEAGAQVNQRLIRLSQLAHEIKDEVTEVSRLDSRLLERLQRGS